MRKVFSLLLVCLAACQNNSGKTKAEKIDYVVQETFANNEFAGNILVADQGEIIYQKSFGNADQENKIQNTDSTKFLIASISKSMTAILILRLVEKNIISLRDTIGTYFPKANSQVAGISVHQLLTHTSGIPEIINKEKDMDIALLMEKATLKSEPGSDFEYSNSGYVILKKIAELATQKRYEELAQAEIFDPANMTSSGIVRTSNLAAMAKGYHDPSQTNPVSLDFPIENIDGAGSVYSTTGDLFKLDRILYTKNLLSIVMLEEMLKQQVPQKYAYGWFVRERGGVWGVYWQKGNLPGFTSFISRRTQKNQCIVLLANAESAELSDLENEIAEILKTE